MRRATRKKGFRRVDSRLGLLSLPSRREGNVLEALISVELVMLCAGYFIGHLFFGTQRYIVYPILVLSVFVNLIADRGLKGFLNDKKDFQKILLFTSLFLVSLSVSILYQQRSGLEDTFAQMALAIFGIVFALYVIRYLKINLILFVGSVTIVIAMGIYLFSIPQEIVRGGAFENVSSNTVSAELIWLVQLLYTTWIIFQKRKPAKYFVVFFLPSVALVVTCAIAGGRSGLICSAILLAGVVIDYCSTSKISGRSVVVLLILLGSGVYLLLNFSSLSNLAIFINFDTAGIESSARDTMLSEYVAGLENPWNLLFGVDLQQLDSIRYFAHPHNSYIRLHSYSGMIGFLLVLVLMLRGIWRLADKRIGIFLVLLAFPIRIMTDSVCFFSNLDFVIFLFCIIGLLSEERMRSFCGATIDGGQLNAKHKL